MTGVQTCALPICWLAAKELIEGDLLLTVDGKHVPVQRVVPTLQPERVYNLRIADFHTYFVGCDEWGFSVWAHLWHR